VAIGVGVSLTFHDLKRDMNKWVVQFSVAVTFIANRNFSSLVNMLDSKTEIAQLSGKTDHNASYSRLE